MTNVVLYEKLGEDLLYCKRLVRKDNLASSVYCSKEMTLICWGKGEVGAQPVSNSATSGIRAQCFKARRLKKMTDRGRTANPGQVGAGAVRENPIRAAYPPQRTSQYA
jgi:hypothetical protein